jgi:hypothetical protein
MFTHTLSLFAIIFMCATFDTLMLLFNKKRWRSGREIYDYCAPASFSNCARASERSVPFDLIDGNHIAIKQL